MSPKSLLACRPRAQLTTLPAWLSRIGVFWMAERERKRILIVDDDSALLNFVRILLTAHYEVETAQEGPVAVAKAEASPFDLIILDLRMPMMDGRTVFRELRTRKVASKVLILSAFGAEEARAELGADASLLKPFEPDRLLIEVRGLLGQENSD